MLYDKIIMNKIQNEIKEYLYKIIPVSNIFEISIFDKLLIYEDYMPSAYDDIINAISNTKIAIINSDYKKINHFEIQKTKKHLYNVSQKND